MDEFSCWLDYSEDNFVVNGYLIETLRVNKGQGAEGQTGKSFMIHMTHSGGGDWS